MAGQARGWFGQRGAWLWLGIGTVEYTKIRGVCRPQWPKTAIETRVHWASVISAELDRR